MRFMAIKTAVPVVLLLLSLGGCATTGKTSEPTVQTEPGIAVEKVGLAAGGLMLDLRYRITDPSKAARMLTRKSSLWIEDQKSGRKLFVPDSSKIGKLRQVPAAGASERIYWMLFSNSSGVVRRGDLVTLRIDDVRIDNIRVQ
jgi:hypothetical protein